MNRHLRKLAIGEWGPGEFRHHLRQTGTPLVERAGPGEVAVTFVDEPADADSTVHLRLLIGYNTIEPELEPVAGTPFRAVTLRMRSDLRFSYAFARHRPSGAPELVRDPFNPPPRLTDPRLQDALAVLPDAAPLPWLDAAATRPAPALEAATLASEVLGNERRIWISPSPGTAAQPLVIVFDGTAGHSAPAVRDALVHAGRVRPCTVVLVDQIGLRDRELTCNPAFSRMLVEELLPWLHRRHPLSHDPRDVALAGSSFGGLCAAWTALHHPDVFGNAIIQTPSCWYHPDLPGPAEPGPLLRRTPPTPTLIADFAASAPAPIRIFHEAGDLEDGPPPAQIRRSFGHRWLHDVLTSKGYDTVYREFAGGHDAAWWRGTFADAVQWVLPS
jgi:enterochelin esterase-like enzyme